MVDYLANTAKSICRSMRKEIASLHCLTQDLAHRSHAEQVRTACEAGVDWVQLRVKNQSHDDWLNIAQEARAITNQFQVILIINDSVEIARAVNADGVHLGQEDLSPMDARKILGEEKIIGYSAHSLDEILAARYFDIDYFGLGPFRFTSTKERLEAVLGFEGIQNIIQRAKEGGILKPIIAIGGIQLKDVHDLIQKGVDGIAVSSAINLAGNPKETIRQFQKQLLNLNRKPQAEK